MNSLEFSNFNDFWPYYLSLHSKKITQRLHTAGLIFGVIFCFLGGVLRSPSLCLVGLICGYGLAWFSHFAFEKNKPATWQYPAWSFLADFKMALLILSGKL